MNGETILDLLGRDLSAHVIGAPASEEELARLESALGFPLPGLLRALLARFGGGLFYGGHEIFGPRRVLIHDIELIPDLMTMRQRVSGAGPTLPPHLLPFHRVGGILHLLDLRPTPAEGRVLTADGSASYPDLETFLERVVLAGAGGGGEAAPGGA